jgi:hypothetical protein
MEKHVVITGACEFGPFGRGNREEAFGLPSERAGNAFAGQQVTGWIHPIRSEMGGFGSAGTIAQRSVLRVDHDAE